MPTATRKQTFEAWMRLVNRIVQLLAGVSVYDLPDCCFADWHAEGMSAKSAARKAIKASRCE